MESTTLPLTAIADAAEAATAVQVAEIPDTPAPPEERPVRKGRYRGLPTRRIDAGGGYEEWFEVYTKLPGTKALEMYALANVTITNVNELTGEEIASLYQRQMKIARLAIKAWSFVDEAGQPLEITDETLTSMSMEILEPLLDFVQENAANFQ